MRSSKVSCLAFGALNLAVFIAASAPRPDSGLEARLSFVAANAEPSRPAGRTIAFRLAGDYPEPPAAPTTETATIAAPDERVDETSVSYLGSMTSPEGKAIYFFKNKASNRVYSSGGADGGIVILSIADKEFLLEIDGKKYKVSR